MHIQEQIYDVIIIGGGAGGFFSAINIAEKYPNKRVLILEKNKEALAKVRISGGGRCNVTNGEFTVSQLVKNYPRGQRELLGAFHKFMTSHTIEWFESRGVALKTEADGRVFPQSDSSQSVVNCLLNRAKKNKVVVEYQQQVQAIVRNNNYWEISTKTVVFRSEKIVIATGSNLKMWDLLQKLGHTIISPVPSLFTFNTKDDFIKDLSGVALPTTVFLADMASNPLKIKNKRVDCGGISAPLLITHWGFSGPAVLKLSAWGARVLADLNYRCKLHVNWLTFQGEAVTLQQAIAILQQGKAKNGRKLMSNFCPFELPKRLWIKLLHRSGIALQQTWATINKGQLHHLAKQLILSEFVIDGKSIFKDEFVTAGGVALKEVDFKTFKSKVLPDVYFCGEVLDIDAITGGFNFQNAWTGGYLVAENIFP
ncbi:NAD(P)/FAD-dependent oxidoreductase [Capnocytophaga canimorsus]|uniref:NAD(P)/FAD-dependent oxidoreductase n=1 Tax=Capnocytophaga canimorsus TaxID=28188 RepID=UPI001AC0E6F5|nr:NAD(P)/FAD-dependent oxidoreductase [Capnocytophaga canimorsus]GIM58814.1 flavoprotein [Capnocytophaga canimorsus]